MRNLFWPFDVHEPPVQNLFAWETIRVEDKNDERRVGVYFRTSVSTS